MVTRASFIDGNTDLFYTANTADDLPTAFPYGLVYDCVTKNGIQLRNIFIEFELSVVPEGSYSSSFRLNNDGGVLTSYSSSGNVYVGESLLDTYTPMVEGDTIGIYLNEQGYVWYLVNNVVQGGGVVGVSGGILAVPYAEDLPVVHFSVYGSTSTIKINDSHFNFKYGHPSGPDSNELFSFGEDLVDIRYIDQYDKALREQSQYSAKISVVRLNSDTLNATAYSLLQQINFDPKKVVFALYSGDLFGQGEAITDINSTFIGYEYGDPDIDGLVFVLEYHDYPAYAETELIFVKNNVGQDHKYRQKTGDINYKQYSRLMIASPEYYDASAGTYSTVDPDQTSLDYSAISMDDQPVFTEGQWFPKIMQFSALTNATTTASFSPDPSNIFSIAFEYDGSSDYIIFSSSTYSLKVSSGVVSCTFTVDKGAQETVTSSLGLVTGVNTINFYIDGSKFSFNINGADDAVYSAGTPVVTGPTTINGDGGLSIIFLYIFPVTGASPDGYKMFDRDNIIGSEFYFDAEEQVTEPVIDSIALSLAMQCTLDNNLTRIDPSVNLSLSATIDILTEGSAPLVFIEGTFSLTTQVVSVIDSKASVICEFENDFLVEANSGVAVDILCGFAISTELTSLNNLVQVWASWQPKDTFALTNNNRTAQLIGTEFAGLGTDCTAPLEKVYFEIDFENIPTVSFRVGQRRVDSLEADVDSGYGINDTIGVDCFGRNYLDGNQISDLYVSYAGHRASVYVYPTTYNGSVYVRCTIFSDITGLYDEFTFALSDPDGLSLGDTECMRLGVGVGDSEAIVTLVSDPSEFSYSPYTFDISGVEDNLDPGDFILGLLGSNPNPKTNINAKISLESYVSVEKDGYQGDIKPAMELELDCSVSSVLQMVFDITSTCAFTLSSVLKIPSGKDHAVFAERLDPETWGDTGISIFNDGLSLGVTSLNPPENRITLSHAPASGKFYIEFEVEIVVPLESIYDVPALRVGIMSLGSYRTDQFEYDVNYKTTGIFYDDTGDIRVEGSVIGTAARWADGDIVGVAIDVDSGKIWFALNNVWQGGGTPWDGNNPIATVNIGVGYNIFASIYKLEDSEAYLHVKTFDDFMYQLSGFVSGIEFEVEEYVAPKPVEIKCSLDLSTRVVVEPVGDREYALFDTDFVAIPIEISEDGRSLARIGLGEGIAQIHKPLELTDKFYFEISNDGIGSDFKGAILIGTHEATALPDESYAETDGEFFALYPDSYPKGSSETEILSTLDYKYDGYSTDGGFYGDPKVPCRVGVAVDVARGAIYVFLGGDPVRFHEYATGEGKINTKSLTGRMLGFYLPRELSHITIHTEPGDLLHDPPDGFQWGWETAVGSVLSIPCSLAMGNSVSMESKPSLSITGMMCLDTAPVIIGTEQTFQPYFNLLLTTQVWAMDSPLIDADFNMALFADVETRRNAIATGFSLGLNCFVEATTELDISVKTYFAFGTFLVESAEKHKIILSSGTDLETDVSVEIVEPLEIEQAFFINLNCTVENQDKDVKILSSFGLTSNIVSDDSIFDCSLPVHSTGRWT